MDNRRTGKKFHLSVTVVAPFLDGVHQVENLPPLISYSPLNVPLRGDRCLKLMRRDLFDARFQLISESSTAETSKDLEFVDAPSDLVPGVYEGGLKTWECSSDLACYLHDTNAMLANGVCRSIEVRGFYIDNPYLIGRNTSLNLNRLDVGPRFHPFISFASYSLRSP